MSIYLEKWYGDFFDPTQSAAPSIFYAAHLTFWGLKFGYSAILSSERSSTFRLGHDAIQLPCQKLNRVLWPMQVGGRTRVWGEAVSRSIVLWQDQDHYVSWNPLVINSDTTYATNDSDNDHNSDHNSDHNNDHNSDHNINRQQHTEQHSCTRRGYVEQLKLNIAPWKFVGLCCASSASDWTLTMHGARMLPWPRSYYSPWDKSKSSAVTRDQPKCFVQHAFASNSVVLASGQPNTIRSVVSALANRSIGNFVGWILFGAIDVSTICRRAISG